MEDQSVAFQEVKLGMAKFELGSLLQLKVCVDHLQGVFPKRNEFWILAPAGIYLSVFMLLPLAIIAVFSFGSRDELGRMVLGFSFDNYFRFFQGPYLNCLFRSILLSSGTTLVCLLVGFPVAMWLAFNVDRKNQNLFMILLTVPLSISFLLRIYAWLVILRPTGIIHQALSMIGVQNVPPMLYCPSAVLLGMVYNYLPYMILPLYAALEKLDKRLVEASYDLGYSPFSTFFKVIVPLSFRGMVAGTIMVFVPALGDYVTPDLMGGAKNMYIGSLIQNQFLFVRDWAFGAAVSTILLVIVSIAVVIYLKYGERS